MIRIGAAVVVVALLAALVGCGGSVDRTSYVEANETLFKELPEYPGAHVRDEISTPYSANESGPVVGYGTRIVLTVPQSANAVAVGAFFRQNLRSRWRLFEPLKGPILHFRRGRAMVSVDASNVETGQHTFDVFVDHEYFGKAGR